MVACPVLGRVPGVVSDELKIKASQSGVVFLPQTRYRTRYTGSKFSKVDINGKLYVDGKQLDKILKESVDPRKKKSGRLVSKPENMSSMENKDTNAVSTGKDGLSPLSDNLLPLSEELSTGPAKQVEKNYFINKKQVRQRILGYLNTQKGKKELYFWTITFPAKTPDDLCYQLFNIWLTSLRKYRMLRDYIWIAERQPQKTNTIHFHLAIPHRMCVQRANAMMAGTLKTFAKRGGLPFTVWQCARYNGVDIAKDRKTKRVINFANKKGSRALAIYLTKYITKNDSAFTHLAWHNSRGYSSVFTGVTFTVPEFRRMGYNFYLDRTNIKKMEFAVFIPWINGLPPPIADHLYELNSYIQETLN